MTRLQGFLIKFTTKISKDNHSSLKNDSEKSGKSMALILDRILRKYYEGKK